MNEELLDILDGIVHNDYYTRYDARVELYKYLSVLENRITQLEKEVRRDPLTYD